MSESFVDIAPNVIPETNCNFCDGLLVDGECWDAECVSNIKQRKSIPAMFNITPWCKKYNKQPSHFLDNNCMRHHRDQVEIIFGRHGQTKIPGIMVRDFFLWLSEETRYKVTHNKLEDLL